MPTAIQGETWSTSSPDARVQTAGWIARGSSLAAAVDSMLLGATRISRKPFGLPKRMCSNSTSSV
jgi:hypothetical protein